MIDNISSLFTSGGVDLIAKAYIDKDKIEQKYFGTDIKKDGKHKNYMLKLDEEGIDIIKIASFKKRLKQMNGIGVIS